MIVEDEIRAKGLGVVLQGSIGDEGCDEDDQIVREPAPRVTFEDLQARYYRARFEACRDGMWFSIALNAILAAWIAWAAWRW